MVKVEGYSKKDKFFYNKSSIILNEKGCKMIDYLDFIKKKDFILQSSGFDVDTSDLNPELFDFQKDIVRWALKKGRSAIFADCGLGKTLMQLEWSQKIHEHTGGKVLILAPLTVVPQMKKKNIEKLLTIMKSNAINKN